MATHKYVNQLGQIMSTTVCPSCQGFGTLLIDPCSSWGGIEKAEKSFSIEVPKGVDTGITQRLSGMGLKVLAAGKEIYTSVCS